MKVIFFIYQWLIAVPILGVLTILTALTTIIGSFFGSRDFWGYWPPHYWSRCVCFLLGVRVKVKGRENIDPRTSYVFVANHQGAFDIWAIYGYLNHNFKWMMKKELERVPFIGVACKSAGHIFVDDASLASIKETIRESEEKLRDGMSMVIFPEGSRSWDGHMIPFKRGAFMLAGEFRLPVVPITIDGSFEAMPRTTYTATPTRLTMTIHKPIYPGEKGFNTKQLMAQCRETINSALPERHKDKPAQSSSTLKSLGIGLLLALASLTPNAVYADTRSQEQIQMERELPTATILGDEYYYYTTKKDDSVFGICYKFGWDEALVRKLNPEAVGALKKDQRIYYPKASQKAAEKVETQTSFPTPDSEISHLVKKGETVYSISRLYGVPVERIYDANPSTRQGLKAGETISIPTVPSDKTVYYTVVSGDTMYGVARKFNTTIEDILRLNPGVSERNFRAGSIIRVKPDSAKKNIVTETVEETAVQSLDSYKVKKEDTWSSIARENNVSIEELREANPGVKQLKKNELLVIPEMGTIAVEREVQTQDPRETTEEGIQSLYDEVHGLAQEDAEERPEADVVLLLDSPAIKRDIDFTRGFLIAVDDLKGGAYDINVKVVDGSKTDNSQLANAVGTPDFIIATHESIPQDYTDYARDNSVEIISVFDVKNREFLDNPNVIQMLPQSSYFNAIVASRLGEEMAGRKVIAVGEKQDDLTEELLTYFPEGALTLTLEELGEYELTPGMDYLFLGNVTKKDEISSMAARVQRMAETHDGDVNILARPNWIVYAEQLKNQFGKAGVMIPSRFYFDESSSAGTGFLSHYREVYGHDPVKSFPLYAASGYDTGMYLIPQVARHSTDFNEIAASGAAYRNDYVQAATDLQRVSLWGGFVNQTVYLLRFLPGGYVDQITLRP